MPKGGDLHSHLSGAIYAESYIAWAAADGLCLIVASQTFARFGAAGERRVLDMIAETVTRAAEQNIGYLELMASPGMATARRIGATVGWDDDPDRLLAKLRAAGLDAAARHTEAAFAGDDAAARRHLRCAEPAAAPACGVTVRYIAQVVRVFPKEQVFAQIALGFLLAEQSPLVVGLNLVAPEDDRVSLADYSTHMSTIGALCRQFPAVRVTLHAGELAPGLVPPAALRSHIAEAVRIAGASRIGHGVDILHENDPYTLLAEMADRRIMVEVNLSSNDVILGVVGADHPFDTYRAFGVPLALSTDDEGVARIDLTHEYRRVVQTYDLDYADVKLLSRNSLTYAFVDGGSLWADPERAAPVAPCRNETPGSATPAPPCADFLAASTKARLQWALEAAWRRFETTTLQRGH